MSEIACIDDELYDLADARVPVLDHAFLYGDGVFEGLRFSPAGILLHHEHFARLARSAAAIRIPPPDRARYEQRLARAIDASGLASGYIRVVLTRGCGTLGIKPTDCHAPKLVIVVARLALYPDTLYHAGLKAIIARTRKVPRSSFDGRIKACSYLTNIMATCEYLDRHAAEAIMLDQDGDVSEATVANVFAITGDRMFTPSLDTNCLDGITRAKVLELAPYLDLRVEERRFKPSALLEADEVFLTGTGAGIIAISQVDGHPIGGGRMGPTTARLRNVYESRLAGWSNPALTPAQTRP